MSFWRRMAYLVLGAVLIAGCQSASGAGDTNPATSAPPASTSTVHVHPETSTSPTSVPPGGTPPVSVDDYDRVLTGEEVFADGFVVPEGEVWGFDPNTTTLVEVSANVIVEGTLVMRPADPSIVHTLRFTGIDEGDFTGGGMVPLETDVGLWVMGSGSLDLEGAEKVAWSYEWQDEWEGEEVLAAPHLPGVYDVFSPVAGPADVPAPNDLGFSAELLNLTRNVVVEGTPEGRTHIFIHSASPQTIRYALIRHVGPVLVGEGGRQADADMTGRYGLHFHHNSTASAGSLVEGVVVRDAGNHAFVPHGSYGITFRDTIAYDVSNSAYWWDPTSDAHGENESNEILYERAVAALVTPGTQREGAFELAEGEGSRIIDSVVVGVQRSEGNGSAFNWPGTEQGVWGFEGNLAHNNDSHAIFVWQNTTENHVIDDFTGYYHSQAAIVHGAYRNSFVYRDLLLLANDERRGDDVAIELHAVARPSEDGATDVQLWDGIETEGAVLRTAGHAQDPLAPVRFVDCDFSAVVLDDGTGHPSDFEFVDCGLEPDEVTIESMHPDSIFKVQNGGAAWALAPDGTILPLDPFAP